MSIDVLTTDRIAMSQKERDVRKILHGVLQGDRTQAEAARLLGFTARHVRRLQRRLQTDGDQTLVHGLCGRPSNHRADPALRRAVLEAYRQRYADFGPTFACEKLADEGLLVLPQTLRRWLIAEGLWQRRRQRDPHRSRRPRRDCFGELVQIDASIHDWLEGRGETMVLINMKEWVKTTDAPALPPLTEVFGAPLGWVQPVIAFQQAPSYCRLQMLSRQSRQNHPRWALV